MEEAIKSAVQNAQSAAEVLRRLDGKLKNPKLLWAYFHLRPTASGVTIVSHHPCAPMRGAECMPETLEEKLVQLDGHLRTLAAEYPDENKLLKELGDCGFDHRKSHSGQALEEEVQAAFIAGMVSQGAEYEGIHFLASELILPDWGSEQQNRLDVVGYRDGILYIFELKRGRTTAVYEQVNRYRTHLETHRREFEALLSAYPRTACPEAVEIREIRYTAVMKDARLSPHDWQAETVQAGVDTWFFRPALAFRKLKA